MPRTTGARRTQPKRKRAAKQAEPFPDTRTCRKCNHTRPLSLFAKAGKGKHSNLCRQCDNARQRDRYAADPEAARAKSRAKRRRNLERCREQAKARYWSDPDKHRAAARERARSERGRARNRRAVASYRHRHPEVDAAQRKARAAVRRGELKVPQVCEVRGCGRTVRLHLHHERYDRPLEVQALCAEHHLRCHREGALRLKDGSRRRWARAPAKNGALKHA